MVKGIDFVPGVLLQINNSARESIRNNSISGRFKYWIDV